MPSERTLDELAFYTLAGSPESSRDIVGEVIDGERLGLGTAFISERYNRKEAATLSGAAGAVSDRIRIATAATNHNTRHPMVTAGFARTMQSLTGGRFVLGLGRGIKPMQDAFGIPRITTAELEDFAGLMRRLFRGEVILGHDGPAGSYPVLHLDATLDEYLPLAIVAFGPNTLSLAGRCFDDVVLHTYFSDETTARCLKTVKTAAEQAGSGGSTNESSCRPTPRHSPTAGSTIHWSRPGSTIARACCRDHSSPCWGASTPPLSGRQLPTRCFWRWPRGPAQPSAISRPSTRLDKAERSR